MLLIVSTKDRPGITGICLYNLVRNISTETDLIVLDDHSSYLNQNWFNAFRVKVEHVPDGKHYAIARLELFLSTKYEHCLFLDSDVITERGFDQRIKYVSYIRPELMATGYISRLHKPETIIRRAGHCLLPSIGGSCMFTSRDIAQRLLNEINKKGFVNGMWDHLIREVTPLVVSTSRSVVQHIGMYEGLNTDPNNISGDYAEDFGGSILIGTP